MRNYLAQRRQGAILFCGLLTVLTVFGGCTAATGSGGGGSTAQNGTPTGGTPTATVNLNNLSKLLMLSHEKGPQDVTYVYTSTVKGPQGTADGSGHAIFTRSPQRFLLDITFPTATFPQSAPDLRLRQQEDHVPTRQRLKTSSTTTNIEPSSTCCTTLFFQGKEQVNGAEAYHIAGTLCQKDALPSRRSTPDQDLGSLRRQDHAACRRRRYSQTISPIPIPPSTRERRFPHRRAYAIGSMWAGSS